MALFSSSPPNPEALKPHHRAQTEPPHHWMSSSTASPPQGGGRVGWRTVPSWQCGDKWWWWGSLLLSYFCTLLHSSYSSSESSHDCSALLLLTFCVDRVPVVDQVAEVREVRAFPIRNGRRRGVWLASYLFGFRSAEYRRRPACHRRRVHRHGGARGGQVGAFVRGALQEQSFCTSRGCSGPPH